MSPTSEVRRDSLTGAEQAALAAAREEWLRVGLSTEPADRPEAEAAVKDLYAVMGWREPMVVWMGSPLGGCFAAAWFEAVGGKKGQLWRQLGDQLGDQLWHQLRNQLGAQLGAQLWHQLRSQLWDQLGDQLRNQLWRQLRDQFRDQLGNQLADQLRNQLWRQLRNQLGNQLGDRLRNQLRDQLWDQCGGQVWGHLRGQIRDQVWGQVWGRLRHQLWGQLCSAWWGSQDAYWVAWLRFAREVGATYDDHLDRGLEAWSRITRSCGWWWPREGVVIMTERPRLLLRDPANRLHCEDGPAIMYPDGWGVWAWHGMRVGQEIIEGDVLDADRITSEPNAELRRCYMEIYGQGRYMAEAGGELLDEVHEPPFVGALDAKLWRLPNPDGGEPFVTVECTNSTVEPDGSRKRYSLWVHPELRPLLPGGELGEPQELTAINALASTFGERGEDYATALVAES